MGSSMCQYPSDLSWSILWALPLPGSNLNVFEITLLLNGLKFFKEFNFLITLLRAIRDFWSYMYEVPQCRNTTYGLAAVDRR